MSAQATSGFRLVMGPMTIAYDLLFPPREVTLDTCDATGKRQVSAFHVQQQTATFIWNSPCRCFRAALKLGINDCANSFKDVSFKAEIDLSPSESVGALR
jgi:LPS-assembly protein